MENTEIDRAIEEARAAAERSEDFGRETYLAVLLANLVRGSSNLTEKSLVASQTDSLMPTHSPAKRFTPPELFASANWATENDKVVLAAYFLERYTQSPQYGLQELRDCLVSAKVQLPKNVSQAIIKCVQRGWMMEIPGSKEGTKIWSLTHSGELRAGELLKKQ